MYSVLEFAISKYVADVSVTFICLLFSYLRYKLFITQMAGKCCCAAGRVLQRKTKDRKKNSHLVTSLK
jgi:hypothetical protein